MPKIVALPNGQEAEFPDDMSNDAIGAVLRKQFPNNESAAEGQRLQRNDAALVQGKRDQLVRDYRSSQPNAEQVINRPPGGVEEFIGGAKHAWDRAAAGLEGASKWAVNKAAGRFLPEGFIDTELDPETKARLEQGQAFVKDTGPASTVGQITGDVAMSAGPVGFANKAVQGARALSMLPRAVARYVPAAADVAANAGYSALTAPENRGEAAMFGGAGAAGGRVLTRALGGAVQPGTNAQELLKQGVRLTPGQVGGEAGSGIMGTLAQQYEKGLTAIPGVGRPVKAVRERSLDDWQRYLNEVAEEIRTLEKARNKAGPISRSTAERPLPQLTPRDALQAGFKADDQGLVDAARNALPILGDTAAVTGIDRLMNAGRAAFFGAVTHGAVGAAGLPPAVLSLLGTTDPGRRFLLGQLSWQQLAKKHPQVAAAVVQSMRAGAIANQESAPQALPRALSQQQEQQP